VEALWDALPESVKKAAKKRNPGNWYAPQNLALDLYENLDKLDLNKAMYNLIANHIEDSIIGRTIAKAQKAGLKRGLNPGALTW
jgi:hypothetical protein